MIRTLEEKRMDGYEEKRRAHKKNYIRDALVWLCALPFVNAYKLRLGRQRNHHRVGAEESRK